MEGVGVFDRISGFKKTSYRSAVMRRSGMRGIGMQAAKLSKIRAGVSGKVLIPDGHLLKLG